MRGTRAGDVIPYTWIAIKPGTSDYSGSPPFNGSLLDPFLFDLHRDWAIHGRYALSCTSVLPVLCILVLGTRLHNGGVQVSEIYTLFTPVRPFQAMLEPGMDSFYRLSFIRQDTETSMDTTGTPATSLFLCSARRQLNTELNAVPHGSSSTPHSLRYSSFLIPLLALLSASQYRHHTTATSKEAESGLHWVVKR